MEVEKRLENILPFGQGGLREVVGVKVVHKVIVNSAQPLIKEL